MPPVLVAERHRIAWRSGRAVGTPGWTTDAVRQVAAVVQGAWRTSLRHRVTGLAAEAGFFALLSLPALLLSVVAGAGLAGRWAGSGVLTGLEAQVDGAATLVLTTDASRSVVVPMVRDVVQGGRLDVVSVGFLVALWSGSRALNVYVDTVSIMYGYGGHRGIVRTRALSFTLYVTTVLVAVLAGAAVLVGVGAAARWLPVAHLATWSSPGGALLVGAVVVVGSVLGAAALYHVATPVRSRWQDHLPGAAAAVALGVVAGALLRVVVTASLGGSALYGPLAAPIVVLLWLYLVALSVLVGAAVNASIHHLGSVQTEPQQNHGSRRRDSLHEGGA